VLLIVGAIRAAGNVARSFSDRKNHIARKTGQRILSGYQHRPAPAVSRVCF
jgi:hypothetical protein